MKKNSKKQTGSTKQYDNPGRPKYTPKFPRSAEWTFTDFMARNGIETNPKSKRFGKGPNCTMLTLRKFMERDMYFHKPGKALVAKNRTGKNPKSLMVHITGVTAEPNSKSGMGRRADLFCTRENAGKTRKVRKATVAKVPKAPKAPKAPADLSAATKQYEEIKNILAQPSPAVAPEVPSAPVSVPVVTIAPEATPAPAPVQAEAPATSTLPVANLEPVAS